ncbi:hypothetical protein H2203_002803 [Taxawa tesnikishii (nom. ined.)]|nr:hypothetical protein H2203_002803 [Dothideales sp. JES 119]
MQFSSLISSLALFVAAATAAPAPAPGMEKRAAGAVYMCTDANWSGICQYQTYALNTCVDLRNTTFADSISSFGPDQGAECMLMLGHCNAEEPFYGDIAYPGYSDLTAIGWNDRAESYICFSS